MQLCNDLSPFNFSSDLIDVSPHNTVFRMAVDEFHGLHEGEKTFVLFDVHRYSLFMNHERI
ncbi:hypothetical protein GCM10011350_03930 [Marinomonas arctica]|nr:hypothetical protein GCM10011350_03930 [Marinomonas arctica]